MLCDTIGEEMPLGQTNHLGIQKLKYLGCTAWGLPTGLDPTLQKVWSDAITDELSMVQGMLSQEMRVIS